MQGARTACLLLVLVGLCQQAPAQVKGLYDPTVLRTLDLAFHQVDWWKQLLKNKSAEIYIKADLRVDGRLYPDVGVRGRGNTAYKATVKLGSKKLPFKISTNEFVGGQDLMGFDKLDLNNGYWDPTFLREVLSMRMMRKFLPAPQANLVKLVINGENWGIYINMQPVDAGFIRERFRNATGNRYKGHLDLRYYGPAPASYTWPLPLKSAPVPNAYRDLIRALAATTVQPIVKRVQEVTARIDVDLVHRHLANNILTGNTDSAPKHNYYLYLDPYHDQMAVIPWDMNVSFWTASTGIYLKPRMFGETDLWRRRYLGHLRNGVEHLLDWKVIGSWATAWHKMIDAEVKADNKKLYSYADFVGNLTTKRAKIEPNITILGLEDAVKGRRGRLLGQAFMQQPRVRLSGARHSPAAPTHTQSVHVTVMARSSVTIHRVLVHYRSRGYFRELGMFDDGKHGDGRAGDGTFGNAIPAQPAGSLLEFYFSAEADLQKGGDVNYLPRASAYAAYRVRVQPRRDSVLIHEFLARNETGIRDMAGDRDDWIELFNPTKSPVDLSARYLTDNSAESTKWRFPNGTIVPAGGRILLWADGEPGEGKLHATFRLSKSGEELAIFDKDGSTALDWFQFGPQHKDISTGRLLDRLSPFVTYAEPTPGRRNELDPCGVRGWSALDPHEVSMQLSATGTFKIGSLATVDLRGGPSRSAYLLQVASAPGVTAIPVLGIWQLIGFPADSLVLLPTDVRGGSSVQMRIPDRPGLVGARVSLQGISYDGRRFLSSNGAELGFCKK